MVLATSACPELELSPGGREARDGLLITPPKPNILQTGDNNSDNGEENELVRHVARLELHVRSVVISSNYPSPDRV